MAALKEILASPNGAGIIRIPSGTEISACTISKPIQLLFEPGIYPVSGTITLDNVSGVNISGSGTGEGVGTAFAWQGNPTDPMFNLVNASFCLLADFCISSSPNIPLSCAIQSPSIPATVNGAIATHNRFVRIGINGTWIGGLQYGFRIGEGSGGNNDLHSFEDVLVENYSDAAWRFENAQSKSHNFRGCGFNGNGIGSYGIDTSRGGSFFVYGISGGGNTEADFYLCIDDCVLISGGNFEGSKRFLTTPGQSANAFPVTVEAVRWAGNELHDDGRAIIYTQRGPLNLIGNVFQHHGKALALHLDPSGPCSATAIGNQVGSTLTDPFTGSTWAKIGNLLQGADGTSAPMSNIIP